MKRTICLALLIVMCLTFSAIAENDFPLHNGLRFGMTKEEVYETEKAAGVLLQEDEIYT